MPIEEYIGTLIACTNRNLLKRMTALLQSYDLTYHQFRVIHRLYEENGLPARELVVQLSSDSSTIMGIIDRLEEKALVKREPDPNDRRVNRILLTDKARLISPEITKRIARFIEASHSLLSPEEMEIMKRGLNRLNRLALGDALPESDPDQGADKD